MITNVEKAEKNIGPEKGIGLYRIVYDIDRKGEKRDSFVVGILAHSNKEATDTLFNFCKEKIKKFKGLIPNEVSYQGLCHAVSDRIRESIINKALNDGKIIKMEEHNAIVEQIKKEAVKEAKKATKKSILPKE